jgi:hypothetical protein
MVLYHKCNAQIKLYQLEKFQKVLFIKILPNFTFQTITGGNKNYFQ